MECNFNNKSFFICSSGQTNRGIPALQQFFSVKHNQKFKTIKMNNVISIITIGLLTISSIIAQTQSCSTLIVKDGMKLIYETQSPPLAMYKTKGDYWKKSEKERQKIDAQFEKENPWTTDIQTNKVQLQTNSDGTIEIITTVSRAKQAGIESQFYAYCINDTIVNRPGFKMNNNGILTELGYYDVNNTATTTGYTLRYENITPNKLEVGQTLMNLPISFSQTTTVKNVKFPEVREVGKEITSYGYWSGASGSRWTETMQIVKPITETVEVDVVVQSSVFSESKKMNRVVKEKKLVKVGNNEYTAFLLVEEIWTGGAGCIVKSDNPVMEKYNKKFDDKMAKKYAEVAQKTGNANEQGYVVNKIETWYIPGLGTYSMTSYDGFGKKIGYLELKAIE
jgi:hypothetical protein